MNAKQFKRMLRSWDESILAAAYPKEAAVSFLKRLQRANQNQELDVVKTDDIKTSTGRQVYFLERRTGTAFNIEVENQEVSLIY